MTSGEPDQDELKQRLTDEQYRVPREKGTPFTGRCLHNGEEGVYSCACCGAVLFSSGHSFESGSGWPGFWLPLAGDNVRTMRDTSLGPVREEELGFAGFEKSQGGTS